MKKHAAILVAVILAILVASQPAAAQVRATPAARPAAAPLTQIQQIEQTLAFLYTLVPDAAPPDGEPAPPYYPWAIPLIAFYEALLLILRGY